MRMQRFFTVLLVAGLMIGFVADGFAKERFRVRLLSSTGDVVSGNFSAPDNVFSVSNFENYFGKWSCYARSPISNEGWLLTYSRLNYQPGDSVVLHQMRSTTVNKMSRRFGIEAEIRTVGNLWLGLGSLRMPRFSVVTVEEVEKMTFLDWVRIIRDIPESDLYYEYFMRLLRQSVVQTLDEEFGGNNFQSYVKYEFGKDSSLVGFSVGVGLDVLHLTRHIKKNCAIYSQMPWTATIIDSSREERASKNVENSFRPFILGDLRFSISKRIDFGAEAKVYTGEPIFRFAKDFLMPVSDPSWKLKARTSAISLYLAIAI